MTNQAAGSSETGDLGSKRLSLDPSFVERYSRAVGRPEIAELPAGAVAPAGILHYEFYGLPGRPWPTAAAREKVRGWLVSEDWQFFKPIHIGETLTLTGHTLEPEIRRNRAYRPTEVLVTNEAGDLVAKARITGASQLETGEN